MDEKKKNWSYKLGYFLGTVVFLCCASLFVAATIKIILWLFNL